MHLITMQNVYDNPDYPLLFYSVLMYRTPICIVSYILCGIVRYLFEYENEIYDMKVKSIQLIVLYSNMIIFNYKYECTNAPTSKPISWSIEPFYYEQNIVYNMKRRTKHYTAKEAFKRFIRVLHIFVPLYAQYSPMISQQLASHKIIVFLKNMHQHTHQHIRMHTKMLFVFHQP